MKTYEHFEIEVPISTDPFTKIVRRYTLETAVRTYESALKDRKENGGAVHLVKLRKVTTETLSEGVMYKGPRPWEKPPAKPIRLEHIKKALANKRATPRKEK